MFGLNGGMFDSAASAPASLMQDPAFAAALRLCGQHPRHLPCGLMVLQRQFLGLQVAMLPRAEPPADLAAQLRAVGLHRAPLILSPPHPCPMPPALRLRKPQSIAILDLTPPKSERRAALHPKWRNQLRRAEEAGLRVTHAPLPPDPNHPLLLADAAQARRRRYATWPAALTAAFANTAPAQTRLFTAKRGRKPVAHMLFLRHGRGATYHIGHICTEGKTAHAHNLLLWQAANWLADQGHSHLDLGPLHPATPGLSRFKLRCGAKPQETGGSYLYWRPWA
ncbi:GNAT family N-acetyltransferase [Sulfitobacter delicatus]|uniref:Acetyltransferase (GNAT) domain-containing protein n=1 Tax=Sulfitobacter delicatus TaxID=218672 RepID=A0A1G7QJX5_9RHOB|nr:GNAT family N-acetyltransferase [Sulfitobacter delicatus]SDF98851.1 Acetyltransferase (GNAT) domain-containing protein [Sulfitobacter delicatus]